MDDNRGYFFSYFALKLYVLTPHMNRLVGTIHMRGLNICLNEELTKVSFNYDKYFLLSRTLLTLSDWWPISYVRVSSDTVLNINYNVS